VINRRIVIGLTGVAGAGKSTIASRIVDLLDEEGIEAAVVSFAGPLKKGFAQMGVTKGHPRYRELLQFAGQNLRDFDEAHWVRQFHIELASYPATCRVFIVDDVRYNNEIAACELTFFVQPLDIEPTVLTRSQKSHASEQLALGLQAKLAESNGTDWRGPRILINRRDRADEAASRAIEMLKEHMRA
jgi:hypothetical protein